MSPKTDKKISFIANGDAQLLAFLLSSVKGMSRNNVKSLLSRKEVLVNGAVVSKHDFMLKPGDTVELVRTLEVQQAGRSKSALLLRVIYEDDEFLAIDKPAGLLSVATDKDSCNTAYRLVTDYVRIKNPKARIFVLHRLDAETSGILLFVKNEKLKDALQNDWEKYAVLRSYTAVVEGNFQEAGKSGTLHSWLKQTKTLIVYESGIAGEGLEAITDYKVISQKNGFSLLDISLRTGRKNQIRVQLSSAGYPVTGDKKYRAEKDPIKRLALHAGQLDIIHPLNGIRLSFKAALPDCFKRFQK